MHSLLRQQINTYIAVGFVFIYGIFLANLILHVAHASSPVDGVIGRIFAVCKDYETCASAE